jgi:hypothetical protein
MSHKISFLRNIQYRDCTTVFSNSHPLATAVHFSVEGVHFPFIAILIAFVSDNDHVAFTMRSAFNNSVISGEGKTTE